MTQAMAYSASEDRMLDPEQDAEIDGVDPWKAAMQGDLDALLQYIDDNGDVNQRDRDNNTPLHWACQESHFDIVGVLMSRNAAVDPVNDLQSTPLHYACREGNLDIVTGLINFNANLEARNKDNLSPLHVAAGMGHIEVTKRLLDNGAHMEAEDNALYTPLWRAAYYGHPEVVEVLLLKGANKLARNKKGRKPGDVFSPTVEEENKERIKAMLGMGGDSVPAPTRHVDPSRSGVGSRPHPPSEPSVPNKPLAPDRSPPPPSTAHSQAEPVYPDPSPSNSAGSNLESNPMPESKFTKVLGKQGDPNGTRNSGVSMEEVKYSAGVQTTPSVNGVEMDRLKADLMTKNKEVQQLRAKVDEYKENLHKAQTDNTRELDNADEQAEKLKRRAAQAESELEMKKGEVMQARREIEDAARSAEERIAQLEQELQMARSKSCACTIS